MIFFGEKSLRNAVREFRSHCNHQGLANGLIEPRDEVGAVAGKIECRERLGGMLRYDYRDGFEYLTSASSSGFPKSGAC